MSAAGKPEPFASRHPQRDMVYQVLARKWRPQDFSSLIGQDAIVTALRNALTDGRIAQAYIFSGIRGVGKTTAARVLAKALSCEKGPAADPCNECQVCRQITAGSDLDVIEVDAATYSKVEQVRELTESLRYGPARNRYKIVVIDEIHRLSRQAFDALLKIVEEPPSHVIFIFATTELESVPATILSRCQEFHFRRVPAALVATHLRQIADAEGVEVSDNALRMIARAGEGSVRDALALLDQLATFGTGNIADEDAARLLGGVDAALFARLLQAILDGEPRQVAAVVAAVEAEGWDPRHVYGQFLSYCRDALHLACGGELAAPDWPREDCETLGRLASRAGYENLLRLLNLLLISEETVRRSDAGTLAVEIAWLKAAELPKLRRIEELLTGSDSSSAATPAAGDSADQGGAGEPQRHTTASLHDQPAAGDAAALRTFLDEVGRRRQALAAHLEAAAGLVFRDGQLLIYRPAGDSWLSRALERPANREILQESLDRVWGAGSGWQLLEQSPPPRQESGSELEPVEASDLARHPVVQTVLEMFDGTVEDRGTSRGED